MAEWNYNNMNHLSLNLPPSFQPENNSSGSYFNCPVSAPLNFGNSNQSRYSNAKFHFGSDSAHDSLTLPTCSQNKGLCVCRGEIKIKLDLDDSGFGDFGEFID